MFDKIAGMTELFGNERNFITNASNMAAYIYHNFSDLNWVGFYFVSGGELVLGPFQGKPACIRIAIGKGVCGTAFDKKETLLVDDVHDFAGHIACDSASNSEIVIPLFYDNIAFGVLDIDSPLLKRFTKKEKLMFEGYAKELVESSDTSLLIDYYAAHQD